MKNILRKTTWFSFDQVSIWSPFLFRNLQIKIEFEDI